MANVTDTGPLDWRIPITDGQGRPSPEFQRRWNTNRNNSDLITTVNFGTGVPTTTGDPDGTTYFNISTNPYTEWRSYGGVYYEVSPVGATPTATASTAPIAGSAPTFMRSDGAPALPVATSTVYGVVKPDGATVDVTSGVISVPTATTSNLGLVKPDGTTITIASGVISSVGGSSFSPAAACTATISGGAVTIQYATNVSSITYTGVGRYRVNFTAPLSNTYYGLAFAGRFPTEVGPVLPIINIDSTSGYGQTTTYVDVGVETAAGVIADLAQLSVLVFNAGTAPSGTYLLDSLGVAANGAYSVRQLKAAATKSMNVRRDSDNATMDIGFVAGTLDTATLLSFVGANGGWVTTWYDQSGNGNNFVQTNVNEQPQIVIGGVLQTNADGKAALYVRGGFETQVTTTASLLASGPFTVSMSFEQTSTGSGYQSLIGTQNTVYGNSLSISIAPSNYVSLFCDGVGISNFTSQITTNVVEQLSVTSALGVSSNALTATCYLNNVSGGSATNTAFSPTVSGTDTWYASSGEQFIGYVSEIIVFGAVLNSTQLGTVYTSQHGAF